MSNDSNLPDYLLEQLQKIAKAKEFIDPHFEQDEGSKHGDGFMSEMIKITITGQQNVGGGTVQPGKTELIVKLMPASQSRRDLTSSDISFDREVALYTRILPLFAQIQTEKGLTEANGFFNYPHCYYAISDETVNQHYLIMDDLRSLGYTLWNKLLPIEYDHLRLVLTAMGRLHALSFVVRDQHPDVFATFRKMKEPMMTILEHGAAIADIFDATYAQCVELFEGLPDYKYMKNLAATWRDRFRKALGGEQTGRFSVIGHGDSWINNFMFLHKDKTAVKVLLLDWQLGRLGSPALDLTLFIMTSTTKALRDKHLDEVLHIYHNELAATVRALGSDPDQLFTFSDLQDQLRIYGHYGVGLAPVFLQVILSKPENIKSMDAMAEQDASKSKDMISLDAATKTAFLERVTDVIHDAKAYGWIE